MSSTLRNTAFTAIVTGLSLVAGGAKTTLITAAGLPALVVVPVIAELGRCGGDWIRDRGARADHKL